MTQDVCYDGGDENGGDVCGEHDDRAVTLLGKASSAQNVVVVVSFSAQQQNLRKKLKRLN